jgi:hypothetical protein
LRRTRRNSRRRSARGHAKSARIGIGRGASSVAPCSLSSTGRTAIRKVTSDDTGLPGRPMNHADEPSPRKTSPKASGLPGFIAICQRSSRPSFSTAGFMWSSSPTDMPPQVTMRSLPRAAWRSVSRVASRRSGTMPRSSQTPPIASIRPRRVKRFEL